MGGLTVRLEVEVGGGGEDWRWILEVEDGGGGWKGGWRRRLEGRLEEEVGGKRED